MESLIDIFGQNKFEIIYHYESDSSYPFQIFVVFDQKTHMFDKIENTYDELRMFCYRSFEKGNVICNWSLFYELQFKFRFKDDAMIFKLAIA